MCWRTQEWWWRHHSSTSRWKSNRPDLYWPRSPLTPNPEPLRVSPTRAPTHLRMSLMRPQAQPRFLRIGHCALPSRRSTPQSSQRFSTRGLDIAQSQRPRRVGSLHRLSRRLPVHHGTTDHSPSRQITSLSLPLSFDLWQLSPYRILFFPET